MVRGLADAILLFALPFLLYGVVLLIGRWLGLSNSRWVGGRTVLLSVLGLALVLLALIGFGLSRSGRGGAYVPAHIDNGRLVPGQIQ